jgi:hypothetical protein
MHDQLSLRCPSCNARLRAARALLGRVCPCPRCKWRVVVRLPIPSDADVTLIEEDTPQPTRPIWRG